MKRLLHLTKLVYQLTSREGPTWSSKPRLFPHKLSSWPPCGTVLTGRMHTSYKACVLADLNRGFHSDAWALPLSSQADWWKAWWYASACSSQMSAVYLIWLQLISLVNNEHAPLLIFKVFLFFFQNPPVFNTFCCALACRANMADTLWVFHAEYWRPDWLKLLWWLTAYIEQRCSMKNFD